jgi:flagella basal body P-ring formation protein FlgA
MTRLIAAVAVLIALAGEARADAAQPTPRLKELVTVTSEIVRIGDLVEHAGASADIAVFRAPDLGQTGSVAVARVVDALRPHNLAAIDTAEIEEVVVTRLSRAIPRAEIVERIARAFAGQFGLGEAKNLSVILDRELRALHVEANATAELAATRLNFDRRTGRFYAAFELPGSAIARRMPLRFTGTVTETVEAATLTRALRAGEVVREGDLAVERRPKGEAAGDAMTAEQATGLAAKRALRAGQLLRSADLTQPQAVVRNETVTIVYQVPGILLTVRGKALESGAVGDMVSVLNVQSKRTIQGKVSGPGRVDMAAAAPLVAAAVSNADNSAQPHTE